MPDSPPESPTLQPVQAPLLWMTFLTMLMSKTKACLSHCNSQEPWQKLHQKTGDMSYATRMGSTNVKIVFGSHSTALAVAGVNIITILSTSHTPQSSLP
ncbi:hypothetical protein BDR04DRAFT_1164341 [Suillus decipiens]|nr:hypothetical protein BDR04DRAFT_1164341 [Suillus decipiens]